MEERSLFLARHASREDFDNPEWIDRAENRYDPGLSLSGTNEARSLGERVARERISCLYSSPYLRTVQTAQYCARALGLPIRIEPGFGEWLNAEWFPDRPRTRSVQKLKKLFPSVDEKYRALLEPEYPESKRKSIERFGRAIHRVLEQTEDGILIVGHGATFEGVTTALLKGDFFDPSADPASLSRFDYGGGSWRMVYGNDTSFISICATYV